MRALIQRVTKAKVTVEGKTIGEIEKGVVALIGVTHTDTEKDAEKLAEKIANLRLFPSEKSEFDRSLLEIGGELMAVSQFTLYGSTKKGRRPDFTQAAGAEFAKNLYEEFVRKATLTGLTVAEGRFQSMMQVELVNDGPVTLMVDSKE